MFAFELFIGKHAPPCLYFTLFCIIISAKSADNYSHSFYCRTFKVWNNTGIIQLKMNQIDLTLKTCNKSKLHAFEDKCNLKKLFFMSSSHERV